MPGLTQGLSGRLLLLTIIFVMIAEILIFVPSVANMRLAWLRDRLNTAAAAGVVIDGLQTELPRSVQNDTLLATGAKLIALKKDGTSTLLAATEVPPSVDDQYDLSDVSQLQAVRDAFSVLLFGQNRVIRVFDVIGDSNMIIEIVMSENKLRAAMIAYAGNVLMISVALSLITASLIFVSINRILIRPIRRLTVGMQTFSERPDDPASLFKPEEGTDELAVAGRHLADMQVQLQKTLRQQKNLADLGLAVSKINHDMRNILASPSSCRTGWSMSKIPWSQLRAKASENHRSRRRLHKRSARLWPGNRRRAKTPHDRAWRSGPGCKGHPRHRTGERDRIRR